LERLFVDEVAFGRYRLIEVIGQGGMGKVYKAHDTVIDRHVAVKVLSTELATEPGFRERFRREAHTAARLTEPHIIPIHDTGEVDGRLYLVMPIIDGIDVGTLLKREGPMSPRRAVVVIEQLAAALDAAHAAGLVHRDVKPSNALMANRDFTYLIDFGIAHNVAATRVTKTGAIIGTLAYMAPERFTTGDADARSDVYSLACVLHECLTGTHSRIPVIAPSSRSPAISPSPRRNPRSSTPLSLRRSTMLLPAAWRSSQPSVSLQRANSLGRQVLRQRCRSHQRCLLPALASVSAPANSQLGGRTQTEPETPRMPTMFAFPSQQSASSGTDDWC
jgi:serine/threonine protein kinase